MTQRQLFPSPLVENLSKGICPRCGSPMDFEETDWHCIGCGVRGHASFIDGIGSASVSYPSWNDPMGRIVELQRRATLRLTPGQLQHLRSDWNRSTRPWVWLTAALLVGVVIGVLVTL